jgi:hypothetical protein
LVPQEALLNLHLPASTSRGEGSGFNSGMAKGRHRATLWYDMSFRADASMRLIHFLLGSILLLPVVAFGQLPSSRCDPLNSTLENCRSMTPAEPARDAVLGGKPASAADVMGHDAEQSSGPAVLGATDNDPSAGGFVRAPQPPEEQGFHWRQALKESLTFLAIEQAYVIHSDFSWVVSENGVPFNHYWRDYRQSLSEWTHSGWNDGDPNWYGYVGHPIQGALTGFIQIQNDPQGQRLEFSRTKAYWWSRFKAGLWNAAYSTQWNLGPVSEVTVEKYGTKDRPPWNYNGSFPCSHHCLTGVGQIDIVMTPLGGTGWLIGEDFLDKEIVRRVEGATQNHLLIDTVRCALNPVRGGANILHGERPWYRASRDVEKLSFVRDQKKVTFAKEIPKSAPTHGDVFLGYSHMGTAKCQVPISDAATACNPFSAKISDLGGWNTSVEKRYLRYFGAVADISRQYGGVSESNFLFGLRGGASIGRFRPFAEALVGAVQAHESGSATSNSGTSFAAALGVGADFRLMRRLGCRIQADRFKTELAALEQQNLRVSSGLVIRF